MQDESPTQKAVIKLSRIADEINSKTTEALKLAGESVRSGRSAVVAAIECGKLLCKAKQITGHGKFLKWVADNCPDISERTARNWMLLSKRKHIADLEEGPGLRQAYIACGILPEPKKLEQGIGTASIDFWAQFTDRFNPIAKLLDGISAEDAPQETRDAIKERLKPLVEFYESL